ncbi:hypothetical protein pEaSNUABM10_00254 [Erwinia phage pEa_SNUABM_10]|nr:hypothetical protein pEaSNUABM10_00254 [Erwinia phage pEa_SNUABM_10]
MSKKKNQLTFNADSQTISVNGKNWGNLGLAAWVLERLANRSAHYGGLDFVVIDTPIQYAPWQNFHAIEMYSAIPNMIVAKVLADENYRGGFTNHHFALTSSQKYGTAVPLLNKVPTDIGEDALVFFFSYDHAEPNSEFQWTMLHQMR